MSSKLNRISSSPVVPSSSGHEGPSANISSRPNIRPSARASRAEALYVRELSQYELLSAERELELARAVRAGDQEARHLMIVHNLRLVMAMARRYRNRGVCLLDLVEEGNLGLIRAVDKFDPEHGCRFSTYATWWLRQSIERAIMNHARDVRLPVHVIKDISRCLRQAGSMAHQLGRWPTHTELAAACDKTGPELAALLGSHESSQDQTEYLPDPDEVSADWTPEGMTFGRMPNPEEQAMQDGAKRALYRWLDKLNDQQRNIIRLRFGLGDRATLTLQQTGEIVGLTRERVRQIQLQAMGRLTRLATDGNIEKLH